MPKVHAARAALTFAGRAGTTPLSPTCNGLRTYYQAGIRGALRVNERPAMTLTEEEARKKWCPFERTPSYGTRAHRVTVAVNRADDWLWGCMASDLHSI